ncbi:MAG TPA: hypothetical protein VJ873_03940 [bacterium]|nr:hypothetical protein [bacterium]
MALVQMMISSVIGMLGGYYMYRGKKTQNVKMILWGAAMVIASYFLFSGSSSDKATQDALKNMMQVTPVQQLP